MEIKHLRVQKEGGKVLLPPDADIVGKDLAMREVDPPSESEAFLGEEQLRKPLDNIPPLPPASLDAEWGRWFREF